MDQRSGSRPLILDGGLGTELQRRGRSVTAPWWTAHCLRDADGRRLIAQIHAEYVTAGADVITADTFRTTPRAAHRAGIAGHTVAADLVRTAVALAREAADTVRRRVLVAGSVAPVEDCYRPDLVPNDGVLRREHAWLAEQLARTSVDLVLVETMNTAREAVAATRAVCAEGLPAWVSFVCTDDARLLSGTDVVAAATAVRAAGADMVLVNCTDPAGTDGALRRLRRPDVGPLGGYPNLEDRRGLPPAAAVDRYLPPRLTPDAFAELCAGWYYLDVVGGCCGSTPTHIAALRGRFPVDDRGVRPRESG
ncbi:homocysteine S-methyltransferase family protein [Salinispora arenicola]|uniref:homocysteine S-methyltransferase family protein n=1 Tax=Salinispora arenicola TaxID=168697 RepID=UPI00036E7843|nr:homocysteine S-methyltransferase family protein [Salinispora arenicola]NIL41281.1 homocysteine S-methyltransferase family protein [Salinispora arenicola]